MPAVSVVSIGVDWDGGVVRSASGGVDSADPISVSDVGEFFSSCLTAGVLQVLKNVRGPWRLRSLGCRK